MNSIDLLPSRQRFLPFKPAQLLEHALRDPRLAPEEREQFRVLAEQFMTRLHLDFRRQAEQLKALYDPVDPDRDTLPEQPPSAVELERQRGELIGAFRRLLTEGHYAELSRRQIAECVELQNFGGLKVEANLDDYEDLAVFYRGAERQDHTVRRWKSAWRKRVKTCTIFRRAAVLVRTTSRSDQVHLKLFKNIVAEDLEMVLPRVRIRMRWVDGLKIGSGLLGSVGTAAWKAFAAAFVLEPVLFMITLGTFLAAAVRAVYSYVTNKSRYMQALSANLYFQNLANNASVITHLLDSAEAEEAKEMLLAYFILYVERERDYTTGELGRRVQQWVHDEFRQEINFDVGEALTKLIRRGLAIERFVSGDRRQWRPDEAEGTAPPPCHRVLKVYDLPTALNRLDRAWDRLYPRGTGQPDDVARVADGQWPQAAAPSV